MKFRLEAGLYNHMSRIFHTGGFGQDCKHDRNKSTIDALLHVCSIERESAVILAKWASRIGLRCACDLVAKLPLILLNNPYYFPKVTFDRKAKLFFIEENYPLLTFFHNCLSNDNLTFNIVSQNVRSKDTGEYQEGKDYFRIQPHEIRNLSFGEVESVTSKGEKDSDWTVIFNVELSPERLALFNSYMDGGKMGMAQDEDLGPFLAAFKEDDHE